MKFAVVSDTHGNTNALRLLAEQETGINGWIHLGDHERDAQTLTQTGKHPVYVVRGNCDYTNAQPAEQVVEPIPGTKILICHGHAYGVKNGLSRIYYRAQELGCCAVLFGHTHRPLIQQEGEVLLFNPGTLSLPRGFETSTYGILEIDETGRLRPSIAVLEQ